MALCKFHRNMYMYTTAKGLIHGHDKEQKVHATACSLPFLDRYIKALEAIRKFRMEQVGLNVLQLYIY